MNAGRLDRLVELWRYTTAKNSYGEEIKTWDKQYDIWAKLEFLTGSEDVNADKWENKQNINVTIRDIQITVQDRIRYDSKYYNIISINEVVRGMYLKLQCVSSE